MKLILTGLRHLEISHDMEEIGELPPGYILVRVLCCAVCRTDAKMWEQGHRDLVLPRVLGHEMVVIDGEDRRFVVWPGHCCCTCQQCRNGRENLCERIRITGFNYDGGFGNRARVPESSLISVPESIPTPLACFAEPVGCVLHALKNQSLDGGRHVLIYGGGTMGLLTAMAVRDAGGIPLVIEKNVEKIKKEPTSLTPQELAVLRKHHERILIS